MQDVCSLQLPITATGDPPDHLHEHLRTLDHARDHGPQPARAVWDILEMCAGGRKTEPIRQHMLFFDGMLDLLWWLKARS